MKKPRRKNGFLFGTLWGANGHLLYIHNWPEDLFDPERPEEPCTFCAARGLRHGW